MGADEDDSRPALTRAVLVEYYHDRGLSISEIAAETGWSRAYVWKRMDAFDIERRDDHLSKFRDVDAELLEYLDWLTPQQREDLKAVAIEGRSIAEQARRRGVNPDTVWSVLQRAVDRLESIAREQAEE